MERVLSTDENWQLFYRPISLIMKSIVNCQCVKYIEVWLWNKLAIDFIKVLLRWWSITVFITTIPQIHKLLEYVQKCSFRNSIRNTWDNCSAKFTSLVLREILPVIPLAQMKDNVSLELNFWNLKQGPQFFRNSCKIFCRICSRIFSRNPFKIFLKKCRSPCKQSLGAFQSPQHFYHGNSDSFPWIPPADLGWWLKSMHLTKVLRSYPILDKQMNNVSSSFERQVNMIYSFGLKNLPETSI